MDRRALDRLVYGLVWLACFAPLLWLAWRGFNNDLGANPIDKLIRELGVWGLRLLIVGLAITPAARLLRQPRLIRFRRTIGLFAFAYVLLHLTNYVVTDQWFDWAAIGKDILKRPFITVGMLAFVLLVPLAVTSTNWALRKLGPVRWRRLHRALRDRLTDPGRDACGRAQSRSYGNPHRRRSPLAGDRTIRCLPRCVRWRSRASALLRKPAPSGSCRDGPGGGDSPPALPVASHRKQG